jgi:hypothetical protein
MRMGSTMKALMTAAALLVTFVACAEDAKPPAEIPIDRAAVSGRPQRMYVFYSINPDCGVRGEVGIRIAAAPAHGEVRLEQSTDFPSYGRDNVRFECNKHEVPVEALFYKSSDGYSGPDSFAVEALYPDGNTYTTRFRIEVWPERALERTRTP